MTEIIEKALEAFEQGADAVGKIADLREKTSAPALTRKQSIADLDADIILTEPEVRSAAKELILLRLGARTRFLKLVTATADLLLGERPRFEELHSDWKRTFYRLSTEIEDEDLRSLWARLLAAEATGPGSVPRRVLAFIGRLEPQEARDLNKLLTLSVEVDDVPAVLAGPASYDRIEQLRIDLGHWTELGFFAPKMELDLSKGRRVQFGADLQLVRPSARGQAAIAIHPFTLEGREARSALLRWTTFDTDFMRILSSDFAGCDMMSIPTDKLPRPT